MRRSRLDKLFVPAVVVLALSANYAAAQLKAFPGAEGAGAFATGGRGGDVYHVTKLTDYTGSPPLADRQGTLRHAISSATGARTIVFDVGGTIQLLDNLSVNKSNITVAGQTAPGPGITLRDYTFQVSSTGANTTSDVIVRHIRSRKGDATTAEDAAGVLGSGTTRRVILDHISASWGEDEVLSVTNNATEVTVQYSNIAEGLNPTGHGFGSLIRPQVDSKVSFHHNLFVNSQSRQPRLGTFNDRLLEIDFRNNVVYNWGDRAGYAGGSSEPELEHVDLNYVGNYLIAGPSTPADGRHTRAFSKDGNVDLEMFQQGNLIDSDKDAQRDGADTGWGMVYVIPGTDGTLTQRASAFAFAFALSSTDSAADAYAKVLAAAGALPWNRDATDVRLFGDVKNQTGSIVNAPSAAEWNAIVNAAMVARPAGWDTDGDGMPNGWETANGFNPNVMDNNLVQTDGYTALEHYLTFAAAVPEPAGASLLLLPALTLRRRRARQ